MLTLYLFTKYFEGTHHMLKNIALVLSIATMSACTANTIPFSDNTTVRVSENNPALVAYEYYGMHESTNRTELQEFTGVDPKRTEWCAAFVNSVLEESGLESNKGHKYPLTARAFLDWGTPVAKEDIQPGDVVVFPRGNQGWQGHVGFFIKKHMVGNTEYWLILGGNQSNRVSVAPYAARRSLGIRRPESI